FSSLFFSYFFLMCLLIFLMALLSIISTLFPYTTLFRSPFYINEVRQKNNKVNVLGKLGKEEQIITNVDEIISTTGSRPNFKFLREIRFDRDPAIECAPKLVDIINPKKGIVPPHGEE